LWRRGGIKVEKLLNKFGGSERRRHDGRETFQQVV
jgi:hypothetical protein